MNDPREQAETALKQAQRAAKRGDLREAERWSKTAERLALAAQKLAALPKPIEDPEETERMREEIRDRIRRLAAAQANYDAWVIEAGAHERLTEAARREGREPPPPLRPCPGGEDYIEKIAKGEA